MYAATGTLAHLLRRTGSRRGNVVFSNALAHPFGEKQQPDNHAYQQKKQNFSHNRFVSTFEDHIEAALCGIRGGLSRQARHLSDGCAPGI
jgi:hypothetical protein